MFKPIFTITPLIAKLLIKLEALRIEINDLPITPHILSSLRESSRLSTTHYSTMIEGNKLTELEVEETIKNKRKLPGRERDQWEVLGYYEALEEVEKKAKQSAPLTEKEVQTIHGLVMGGGSKKVQPTPYRIAQNVIRDGTTGAIVYLPPEAKDVPSLMHDLVTWINNNPEELPYPLIATIAHYQYATIHPYIDGNGRTARLLTTLLLHRSGYDLKGIYSLDEYYAKHLSAYYQALSLGPSHNYYEGRAQADITPWIEYFCTGLVKSFENVKIKALQAQQKGATDSSKALRQLDAKQRLALTLFQKQANITTKDIEELFNLRTRSASNLCQKWIKQGFLIISDPSKKSRRYALAPTYEALMQ